MSVKAIALILFSSVVSNAWIFAATAPNPPAQSGVSAPQRIASQDQKSPNPVPVITEEIMAAFVNCLFLFDRLFTKSRTAVSPGYLSRISNPSSRFYPDYLEYKERRMSRAELVGRLPHIAMIGDSLCQNFYISSVPSMFWRARTERRKNWFLDTDPTPQSIFSFYERLDQFTPVVATEYSGDGAAVAPGQSTEFSRKLVRTRNLSGQAHLVIQNKRFPDLIMIWIGHNNADWAKGVSPAERKHPGNRLSEMARQFAENYAQSIKPLIDRAKSEDHKVVIVVFGLADFETFFKFRETIPTLRERNPKLDPYFEITCQRYESFKPLYQKDTTRFSLMMNSELREMVANLRRELKDYPNVRLRYSDALSNVKIRPEILNPNDAWHLSRVGHKIIAQAAFSALNPSLEFLGIESNKSATPHSQPRH